jgi:hypothetical protein
MSTNMKSTFSPQFNDLPKAFKTVTKKGKTVYRIRLNMSEILAKLEEGNSDLFLDVPAPNGSIKIIRGSRNGRTWEAFQYYGWAGKKQEEAKEEVHAEAHV